MSHAETTLTFHVHRPGEPVRTEVLRQDIVKIGKLPSSHLRIDDENVSRMHAVIEVSGEREVHVIDLGSATGTIVNGKKVNKARLESGDEIVLGGARVVVEVARATASAATAAPAPEIARPAATFAAGLPPIAAPRPILPNPFAAPAAPITVAPEVEEAGEVEYGIAASGPALNPADVETMAIAAEVVILWGERSVLHVAHLSPPRAFTIGEPGAAGAMPDFVIDGLALGGDRMPLTVESGGNVAAVIPAGGTGEVRVGEDAQSIEALRASGKLTACPALPGAEQYVLPQGATATVRFHGFTFVTRATSAGRRVGAEVETSYRAQLWTGISLAVHAAFLLMFYFMPPSASALSLDLVRPDDRLVQYLMTPPASVDDPPPDWVDQSNPSESEGGTGQAAADESGSMGDEANEHTTHRYGIEGDATEPQLARERARDEAQHAASVLGSLLVQAGAFSSPTSPYGADTAIGSDPLSALGALMGDQTGANFGFGGLGPSGTGRGGGGTGLGTIGLGRLGTIGHGAGTGPGNGYGDGVGDFHGGPPQHVPHIRTGDADVHGSLSREVIRRTIRRHINEVRFCYEQELSQRPDLAGRVTVSFIISQTGAVASSGLMSSTLSNASVEGCIVSAVRRWTFPAPDGGGVVGVNYPFVLDSTGDGQS